VGGLLALENPAVVHAGLAICVGDACSVAHQTAGFGRLAQVVDRRDPMVGGQRNELYATVVEDRAGTYQQRIYWFLGKARKDRIDVTADGASRTSICFAMDKAAA